MFVLNEIKSENFIDKFRFCATLLHYVTIINNRFIVITLFITATADAIVSKRNSFKRHRHTHYTLIKTYGFFSAFMATILSVHIFHISPKHISLLESPLSWSNYPQNLTSAMLNSCPSLLWDRSYFHTYTKQQRN